ncbi:tRNA uridine-5-carboxymethylaminomethyl(34) synthesis GTPase MnmE [Solibaculum mannosilyticum]|uniref:tRNA modification GTPase MnmE n=1 Tax=Solibaculum mannosilyticum TaxID=2780922 RepID=A0A7I8D453_9FIRM|nr:tRNA uridine-5-carboxymethylaminomethyl(34) synthesis GTPase MnmE [Solibaculum mannosilyticum]BCI61598.1 tRNA modification GTPase MnmE [Solibaculum mannosilyticum]
MSTTIAAIATPQGAGGIGIVRISGPKSQEVADRIFRSPGNRRIRDTAGYQALYGHIYEGDTLVDEAIALVFRAPRSYTGEDVVELSCHGGMYVLGRVLSAALSAGAVAAAPGEFTKRAFLNGKLSLTQAESVMDIIGAQGRQAATAALAAREGVLGRRIQDVTDSLVELAAHLSAYIDYPEDDIPELQEVQLVGSLSDAHRRLDDLLATYDAGKILREGVDTVIVGRPNVGKSTLMNVLSGVERSIVTHIPGTTRDVVEETVRLGDVVLRLADTAGLHETDDPVEAIGVEKARGRLETAGLVLAVFDASQNLEEEDRCLLKKLDGRPAVAVINKTDLTPCIDEAFVRRHVPYVVTISAKQEMGMEQLREAVCDVLGAGSWDPSAGMLANERQRDCVRRAGEAVQEALDTTQMGMTYDAVSVSVEGAIDALLELTGERATEAVVDQVFARFCVGK